jgi:hypothetical protein
MVEFTNGAATGDQIMDADALNDWQKAVLTDPCEPIKRVKLRTYAKRATVG